jgi:prepilin-type N-terminal cleavage/methylation domain-containing protein
MTTYRRSADRAFSLVELLVVIGVITILAGLLLPVVASAQQEARNVACRNNLGQIFKCIRVYANSYDSLLPDLYTGLTPAEQNARYRLSHYCRTDNPEVAPPKPGDPPPGPAPTEAPAGLWQLVVNGDCQDPNVLYCPNTRGVLRRSDIPDAANEMVNGIPVMVGYAYNHFPDRVTDATAIPRPEGLTPEDMACDFGLRRDTRFYATIADVFLNDTRMPHGAKRGLNVAYWDGAVQAVKTAEGGIDWNAGPGQDDDTGEDCTEMFSDDAAGYEAVRDAWVLLSNRRR